MQNSLAELIVSGVRGVLWEENSEYDLSDVIRCVASGSLYFENPQNCRIDCHLSQKICDNLKVEDFNHLLSAREREVLGLIAKGFTYKEIASQLYISSRTVESHKNNILTKLNLRTKFELVRYAIENYNM